MSACYLSEEVKTKLSEIQKEQHNVALILRCNKNSKEVVVDQILEDAGAEEIGNALPDSSPRFLVVRYLIALDSARQQPTLALIHFNPLDTEVPIKMMYQATKPLILQELKGAKEFYLTNTSDFTPEYFSHKVIGLTGKPSDQLVPEEARFNADSRRMSSK